MSNRCYVGGKVIDAQTGQGLEGLRVEAWDKDIVFDDALGSALTGEQGEFSIDYDMSKFNDNYSEKYPDLYFKIFSEETLVTTTQNALLHDASTNERDVVIPLNNFKKTREKNFAFELKGRLISNEAIDFSKIPVLIQAYVNKKEIASAEVTGKGEYSLNFKQKEFINSVDLRVVPKVLSGTQYHKIPAFGLAKTVSASRFVPSEKDSIYRAVSDMIVSKPLYHLLWRISKTYHMYGSAYATTFMTIGGVPTPINIVPITGARIEFFEVDSPFLYPLGTTPTLKESFIGETVTQPDGSYEFNFNFTYYPWLLLSIFTDRVPDVRARISQYFDGTWTQIYEGSVDWNISEDFHRSYFIPQEQVIPQTDPGAKPLVGFRYVSLGLLPIDTDRIVKGYATAKPGDPERIVGIKNQPLCNRLRIFGLFAESDDVRTYTVEYAIANEDGPIGEWNPITDPLHNREWDAGTRTWISTVLGPDPVSGHYTNIDREPEYDWHEHALKFTWYTPNVPNGYYALRITGYKADNSPVGPYLMPVVRIDNTKPDTAMDILSPAVSNCGYMTLGAGRTIRFKVTAQDPEGHMYSYSLSCSRGKHPQPAGSSVVMTRPDPTVAWNGVSDAPVEFTVDGLPAALAACPSVAYNAELHVYGSGTDCYDIVSQSHHVKKEMNLIVSE